MSVGSNWKRFANWPQLPARLTLAVVLALLLLAALPLPGGSPMATGSDVQTILSEGNAAQKDADIALYERIVERVAAGEPYHKVAVEEQRARNFPITPGAAVRLPTLATLSAWLGPVGTYGTAALLGGATLLAWWRRLGVEPGGLPHRPIAMMLLVVGMAMGLKPQYLALHEVWAGTLLALSFALHRGERWIGSFAAAALALAIREHALPFVLLMGAFALWRRRWVELACWALLCGAFLVAMWGHLGVVGDLVRPEDRPSPAWLVMRGLTGFTSNVIHSSSLHFLPHVLAGPLAVLPLLGWAGWKSQAGAFGTLLFAGYALLFMVAGRDNNFYWALMITPAYFMGLAFVPMALRTLWHSAQGRLRGTSPL
ncbi:hypothetical protein [Altererythrobacter fulvus]|uniref:hypothetical protein n=1 Tax=Caenibius fulvus TaxID=2126012 RepID=UPI003016786B